MDKIKAKSVIEDRFWILRKDNIKVGEVVPAEDGFKATINGESSRFKTLEKLKESPLFTFIELPKSTKKLEKNVEGFPTEGIAYNPVWNLKFKLPLYTQTEDSKSWYAAGYYKVFVHGHYVIEYCPKLLTLQRNKYDGPYREDPGLNQFGEIFE